MFICEQKIRHSSVTSQLKSVVCCCPPSLCFCSMYLKHKIHTIMLENKFQQQQGCTNHFWQVVLWTILCVTLRWYWWDLSVELPSWHIIGVWNFKVQCRFLETLCILEWHYSKYSPIHVKYILSTLILNILIFWMVQDSCCHIYIYGNLPYSLYIVY